jgi:hypothetical protein
MGTYWTTPHGRACNAPMKLLRAALAAPTGALPRHHLHSSIQCRPRQCAAQTPVPCPVLTWRSTGARTRPARAQTQRTQHAHSSRARAHTQHAHAGAGAHAGARTHARLCAELAAPIAVAPPGAHMLTGRLAGGPAPRTPRRRGARANGAHMLTGRLAGGPAPRTPRRRGAHANGAPCGGPRPPHPPAARRTC